MKQSTIHYGIAGDGRVAKHFVHYLTLLNIGFSWWSRRREAENGMSISEVFRNSDVVILLLSDSAIENFISQNSFLSPKTLFHFSGALAIKGAHAAHPLMTFGPHLYDLATYESIPFLVENGDVMFSKSFPLFKNPIVAVDPLHRPYIHALCVLAGNFTSILWAKFFSEMEKRNMPHQALLPYLRGITQNIEKDFRKALTGPLARNDLSTIEKNMAALQGDPFQKIYQAFVQVMKVQPEFGSIKNN